MPMKLGYWAIRGLGAPMRMMCEYAGVEYEDVQYADGATWFGTDKPPLKEKNPMINLPYIVDGDVVITQSNSCLMYLGSKLGIDPADVDSKHFNNLQVLMEIFDLRNAMIALVYPFAKVNLTKEDFDQNKADQLDKTATTAYEKLEGFLALNGSHFFNGAAPASADFHVWEMLDQHSKLAASFGHPDPLEKYTKLKEFYSCFRALPQLAKYFASPAYALPLNNVLGNCHFA